jgi:hypothetical protein
MLQLATDVRSVHSLSNGSGIWLASFILLGKDRTENASSNCSWVCASPLPRKHICGVVMKQWFFSLAVQPQFTSTSSYMFQSSDSSPYYKMWIEMRVLEHWPYTTRLLHTLLVTLLRHPPAGSSHVHTLRALLATCAVRWHIPLYTFIFAGKPARLLPGSQGYIQYTVFWNAARCGSC